MGNTTVAKNLKKRTTWINSRGDILERDGFDEETKKERLERKQRERAEKLGLKKKDE